MKKNDAVMLGLTSLICLLPVILSVCFFSQLPEQIAVHWNSAGQPDNYLPKAVVAFALPVFFMAVNLLSKLRLYQDPKRANVSGAMHLLSVWTAPVLSLVFVPLTLFSALGVPISFIQFTPVLVGIILIICGNYLPKSRRNYSVGIKLPWTLHSADNWNRTHRMAGKLWMAGGFFMIAEAFFFYNAHLFSTVLMGSVIALLAVIPMLYSFFIYRKARESIEDE